MKLTLLFALLIFIGSSGAIAQNPATDSVTMAERAYFYQKYRSVRDTMKTNTWLNLKRLSDNLEQVVKRDQQVIEALQQQIVTDSAIVASNHDVLRQYNDLSEDYDRINERAVNDATMLLYLKTLAGVLIFLLLIMLFSAISRSQRIRKYKDETDHYDALAEERQKQIDTMDAELRKQKQREMEFRDELEKGMQLNQERLYALQSRCDLLEKENELLQSSQPAGYLAPLSNPSDNHVYHELPENIDDLKKVTRSLFEERNSLMNLAGKLRIQVEEENQKNRDILKKINLLAKDLTEEE